MEQLINNPWFIIFVGWFTFNVGKFSMAKDLRDEMGERFPILPYIGKNWDNWIFSWCVGVILYIVGYNKIDTSGLGVEWNNLYYLLPGPATEWLVGKYKEFSKKNNKNPWTDDKKPN